MGRLDDDMKLVWGHILPNFDKIRQETRECVKVRCPNFPIGSFNEANKFTCFFNKSLTAHFVNLLRVKYF